MFISRNENSNMFFIKSTYKTSILILFIFIEKIISKNELFQQDLSEHMTIGLTDRGYKNIELKCGSDSMLINLEPEEDFDGVIYTRGSFHDKSPPCFLDPERIKDKTRKFTIKFPFNQCKTKQKGQIYSNVLILQHDKDLIMPGDVAFNLECDFNKPRDVTVNANLQNGNSVISRITPTDPDPALKDAKRFGRSIESETNTVILTPEFFKQRKEEL